MPWTFVLTCDIPKAGEAEQRLRVRALNVQTGAESQGLLPCDSIALACLKVVIAACENAPV